MTAAKRKSTPTPEEFAVAVQDLLPTIRMGGRESHADSIRAQREIGEIVLKFLSDKPKHGDGAYAALGKAVGQGGEWVYRARCFAVRYSKKEMETLLRVAPHISFAHVIQLLSVREEEVREKFETQLGVEHWTVDQLKHAIQGKLGKRRKGGRPVKLPVRPQDGLQEMLDDVITLNKRWRKWGKRRVLSNRATKSHAVLALLKKLDIEVEQFSQAVRSTAGIQSDNRTIT
jgi:hypothetical protein